MVSAHFDSYIEFGRTDKINRLQGSDGESYAWASLSDSPVSWSCVLRKSPISGLSQGQSTSTAEGTGVIFDTTSDYDYMKKSELEVIKDYINT